MLNVTRLKKFVRNYKKNGGNPVFYAKYPAIINIIYDIIYSEQYMLGDL